MMFSKQYFDSSIFANPLFKYFSWIGSKLYYQLKYWGCHLRIGYDAFIRKAVFGRYNYIGNNAYLFDCSVGDFSYIGIYSVVSHTTMGKFCSIGPNVKIAPGKHPTSVFVSTHPAMFSDFSLIGIALTTETHYQGNIPVTIGNDVWIGTNSVILDGVKIGDGAIIAANSVVTKNVEDYCIVGGSPAKFIKKRFEDEQIQTLLKVRWWDKNEEWLKENIHIFWDIRNFEDFFR